MMMSRHAITTSLSVALGKHLLNHQLICTVAESCTGGGLAAAITDTPGSSQWFDRGFVTYSNAAKHEMLQVPENIIASFGAVSKETACAMATGALANSAADISVAITGIAGPDGGSTDKPVGTTWIAWANKKQLVQVSCYLFAGDRTSIRQQAINKAIEGLIMNWEA